MKTLLTGIMLFSLPAIVLSQDLIEVTDQTIRISNEESLYFGFAANDEIHFSFVEVDGKDLREIEILLYPDNTIYSNFKVSEASKTIRVLEEGVYQFRFKHAGMGNRVCRISIQRKPSELQPDFSTTVQWVEQIDTTFKVRTENVVIGYEQKQIERTRKVLASVDTVVETILTRTERIHSSTNLNGNSEWITFEVPQTVYEPNYLTPYKTIEVKSWAYAITTGGNGEAWYKDANNRAAANDLTKGLVSAGVVSTGYGALALLAIEGINVFTSPPEGENVRFEFITSINGVNYKIASGNSVAATGKMTQYLAGGYGLSLVNDNLIDAINVDVNIIAVKVVTTYRDEPYIETKSIPIKEKQVIKTVKSTAVKRVPVIVNN